MAKKNPTHTPEEIQALWDEFLSIEEIDDRRRIIFEDTKKKRPKFKALAENNAFELFTELGGSDSMIEVTENWAFEYTYENWVNDYGEEEEDIDDEEKKRLEEDENWEDENEKKKTPRELEWDLEEESIQRAHDTGYWLQTCLCILEGPDDVSLPFIFGFTEGEFDGSVLENPYTTKDGDVSFGIPFY
jgi:hypothetical protein